MFILKNLYIIILLLSYIYQLCIVCVINTSNTYIFILCCNEIIKLFTKYTMYLFIPYLFFVLYLNRYLHKPKLRNDLYGFLNLLRTFCSSSTNGE